MGKVLMSGAGGGGTGSDECTASRAQVLSGYTAVTSDSDDELATGTMANNGGMSASLNCGQSKTVPAGYTSGGTITANSLASQTGADATAAYIYSGKTAWVNGSKLTGSMTCSSLLSFSVAAYSTSQVLCGWQNPANGPFSGVLICAKTGGYPSNQWDNRVYTGAGDNTTASGISTTIISGLTAGTTYYFRIWAYTNCSAGDFYSGYREATCAPTAHGRQAFTSSGTFTVPAGVRSINIHCTGGGGNGQNMHYYSISEIYGGCGGGGGYTSYTNNISVSPGTQIPVTVGNGAAVNGEIVNTGGTSSVIVNNVTYQASGGNKKTDGTTYRAYGGSGAGYSGIVHNGQTAGSAGGSDGSDGNGPSIYTRASGQGTTTKEFGTGTLYSGGGGGGGLVGHGDSDSDVYPYAQYGAGGAGGGGRGSGPSKTGLYTWPSDYTGGSAGSAGTGGGGGGGGYAFSDRKDAQPGGSGNVIITW